MTVAERREPWVENLTGWGGGDMAVTLLRAIGLPSEKFVCVIISGDNDAEELKCKILMHLEQSAYVSTQNQKA